jgi:uncharacterized protein YecT (DUF1311 family)
MYRLLAAALFCVFNVFPVLAFGAGFDCSKASSLVEKLICSDAGLSKADEELSGIYQEALSYSGNQAAFKKEQLSWLRTGRDSCKTAECLAEAYRKRIETLSGPSGVEEFHDEEKLEMGSFYAHVKLHGEPPFRLIDFQIKLQDSSRVLMVDNVRVKEAKGRALEFTFTDDGGNAGKGTFEPKGKKGILDLNVVRYSEEGMGATMITRNYGTYELTRDKAGSKKAKGRGK